jgi:hypothetical protein
LTPCTRCQAVVRLIPDALLGKDEAVIRGWLQSEVIAVDAEIQHGFDLFCALRAEEQLQIGTAGLVDMAFEPPLHQFAKKGKKAREIALAGSISANQDVEWPQFEFVKGLNGFEAVKRDSVDWLTSLHIASTPNDGYFA